VAQAPVAPAAMATSADAVAVAPALTPVTDSPPRLYLQVGAFVSRDNAESLRRQLEQAEFGSVEVQTATQQETTLYRVRIGPLPNVDASDRLAQRVVGYGIRNAFVTVE
jgi:rare lipoprotein A